MGTRTCTVMFTDMADYTAAVARTDRDGLRRLLAEHEDAVSPIVKRYHGRVVKNLGDSFMCLFDSSTDAVRSALDIQDYVAASGGINIRIGMTTGDVEEIDGDAFGDAVNQAARILSKAPAGEVWFGPGTRVCMNVSEIPWESVGRFPLKGISGDVDLYRAVPTHKCWLPEAVASAARRNRLVRVKRGQPMNAMLPPEAILLLEGFLPGSSELSDALGRLPVLDPASLYLTTYHISSADRQGWVDAGRGLVIGVPNAVDRAIHDVQRAISRSSGADTLVLETGALVDFELVLSGLALPAVPLSEVVESYYYELMPEGRWVNSSERTLLRVEVNLDGPRLVVTAPGVVIDGRTRRPDEVISLAGGTRFDVGGMTFTFHALSHPDFVGAIMCDTNMRIGVIGGQTVEIGREPNHPGLMFADRRGQQNIRWCSGVRAAKARAGGFTMDRALVGRRQAAISLVGDVIRLTPLHERCPTWLLRAGARQLEPVLEPTIISIGDSIVTGTTVVGLRAPDEG